ncbi:alpha/beta hydrolase [Roseovarius sp. Pro17]|uniref:alpha/beta hydrolase n=1 Tax=Roseovarius sp. Pro17 TaxID=3108175 RepID=UPI002D775405|nr:alpha/beta fold hydrolase [Roseovarius sp. Pro17]
MFIWSNPGCPAHPKTGLATALLVAGAVPLTVAAQEAGTGELARVQANVAGREFQVFTYRPQNCASPSILMVFHGNGRGAQSYLKSARDLADRGCFVVYAPLFDDDRFPNWSYHRGGLVHDGKMLPEDSWTTDVVDDLVDWARAQEGRPDAQSYLFGHSAGGQFLSRVAAYDLPDNVERIIIANPSTYVLPTEDEAAPYGFGGIPEDQAEQWLRAYLAAPVTIFLGSEDTGAKDLTMNQQAVRQGDNRVDRGQRTFEAAKRAAAQHGWPFNWELVYADDVGHSGRGMLTANEMIEAMGF